MIATMLLLLNLVKAYRSSTPVSFYQELAELLSTLAENHFSKFTSYSQRIFLLIK